MFSLLSGALSNSISRYITFELGCSDKERLNMVFSTSVTVQIILAILVVVVAEIFGVWFLNVEMNFPEGRIDAANWVFQCSLLTFVINLISVPYNACIIAHEKMKAFAYVSILEAVLKLCSVLLLYVIGYDKLIVYAVLMVCIAIVIRVIYGIYCGRNFEECNYHYSFNKPLIKDMTSLAGWNMLGAGGAVLNDYGVNILMNLSFGVTVNAARGLAVQVNAAVTQFVNSFTTAVNPQITKLYAQSNNEYSHRLVAMSSKYSFFLMLILTAPIVVETPYILQLWLKNVPDYTVSFVRLTLIVSLISTLSTSLYTLAVATGNIKKYQIVVGSLSLSCFLFTYISYKLGMAVETAYYIAIFVNIIILVARIKIVSDLTGFSIKQYFDDVILKVLLVSILVALGAGVSCWLFPSSNFTNMCVVLGTTVLLTFIIILFFGLSKNERFYLLSMFRKKMSN